MDIASLGLEVRSDGVVVASGRLNKFGQDAYRAEQAVDRLGNAFKRFAPIIGAIMAALSGRALKGYADAWSDMQSRVGAAVKNMEAAPALMERLVDIANASYSPLSQTVEVYGRNVAVLRDLGKGAVEAADFTEALNHALVTTATKGQDADVVLNALSRAISIGGLRAMEYETIMSRSPRVLEAVAKELNTTTTGLRTLAQQGKVTGTVIVDGLVKSLEDLRKEAGEMPATIGDAMVRLDTNFGALVGRIDQALGISENFAGTLINVADTMRAWTNNIVQAAIVLQTGFNTALDTASSVLSGLGGSFDGTSSLIIAGAGAAAVAVTALTTAITAGLIKAVAALGLALIANPFSLFIGAIAATVTAAYLFRDEIAEIIGIDLFKIFYDGANAVIGIFVGAFNAMVVAGEDLPAAFEYLGNEVARKFLQTIDNMVRSAISGVKWLVENSGELFSAGVDAVTRMWDALPDHFKNVAKLAANGFIAGIEFMVNAALSGFNKILEGANTILRFFGADYVAETFGWGSGQFDQVGPVTLDRFEVPKSFSDVDVLGSLKDTINQVLSDGLASLVPEASDAAKGIGGKISEVFAKYQGVDYIKIAGEGVTQMWNDAGEAMAKFGEIANTAGGKAIAAFDPKAAREAEKLAKAYDKIVLGARQFIAEKDLESRALFMTEEAAARLRHEQELLNKAANDNIKLTPEQRAQLMGLAGDMAAAEVAYNRLKETFDFGKDLVRGFVSDVRSGLKQGEGVWQSFADAASNALDKISNKLLDMAFDQAINALFGNLLGALGGGMGGGLVSGSLWANGGAFDRGNVIPFAKGGIVDKPTVFPFAKGIGLMGEAGPEAIMPLHRGADGSLGVRAANQNSSGGAVSITVNVSGARGNAEIREMVSSGVSQALREYPRSKTFEAGVQKSLTTLRKTGNA